MLTLFLLLFLLLVEHASAVSNSITSTMQKMLERIQQEFAALCFNRFFPQVDNGYVLAFEKSTLQNLQKRKHA
jgi:hypothetical protein